MAENRRKVGVRLTPHAPKLAPFNPTHVDVINLAMDLVNLNERDVVYDVGCGDGRFVVEAGKRGARGVGVEYDAELVARAQASIEENNLESTVEILHNDACLVDMSAASVIFVYLVPTGLKQLESKLFAAFNSGCRIVSYVFSVPGLEPVRVEHVKGLKVSLYVRYPDVVKPQ